MRFNKRPTPKIGDTKTKVRFAFFPTTVRSTASKVNYTVWLETYRKIYRYEQIGTELKYRLIDKLTN